MMRIIIKLFCLVFLLSSLNCNVFQSDTINLKVHPSEYLTHEIPVIVKTDLPENFNSLSLEEIGINLKSNVSNTVIPGQLFSLPDNKYELCWLLPQTNQNKAVKWKAEFYKTDKAIEPKFEWRDTSGKHLDLYYDNKKVFRYCYELDEHFEKEEILTANNKVFYHIFDLKGNDVITKGPEKGIWPHHRGITIGWRDVWFKDKKLSFWGMEDFTVQKHIKFTDLSAGPVAGKVVSEIHWNDSTGLTLIKEIRTAVIYHQTAPDIMILDFSSKLLAVNGPLKLSGDAEHGGVQFRAHNDVGAGADGSKFPVYYFHKNDIDPHIDYDLPWVGMEYGLRNETYSILDINHPDNPKPSIWSAYRDYGRFGPFITYQLNNNKTLEINYRFWISESKMPDRENLDSKSLGYIKPPDVENLTNEVIK